MGVHVVDLPHVLARDLQDEANHEDDEVDGVEERGVGDGDEEHEGEEKEGVDRRGLGENQGLWAR